MDFKELLKQKIEAQNAILGLVKSENRAMTDEEQAKFDTLENEITSLEKTIAAEQKAAERAKSLKTPINEPILPCIQVNEKKWQSFGEMLQCVKNAAVPAAEGGRIDNRLLEGFKNAATGMNETVNSEGGFLVEEQFAAELLKKVYDTAVVASRIRMIPIGPTANTLRMNGIDETSRANGSRYGGVQAYWAGEAQAVTATKPKFREISMKLEKLMALCYMTDELMTDATALEAVISQAFTDEMAFKLDDAIINGTGVGMPQGVLNSDCLITVAKETSQAAATLNYQNVLKMWARMWARSRQNAVWFINQDIEPQLYTMSLTIGTGGVPVYMPATGASGLPYATLFGRPVIPIEQCSTLGTVGDVVLADMSQYIGIDKGGITPATSVHVRFLYDEQVFRFTYRVNGQPVWNAPLTPFKGANTLSPFVALATRG